MDRRVVISVLLALVLLVGAPGCSGRQQMAPAAASETVELDSEKQHRIWDLEHVTFKLETYLGKPFARALEEGDHDGLHAGTGSRIVADLGGRKIVRDVFPVNGGTGSGPVEMILGLGQASSVKRLSVRWPTGRTQIFDDLPAGTTVIVTEGRHDLELVPQDLLTTQR